MLRGSFSMSYPSLNLIPLQNTSVIFSVSKQKFDWGQRACRPRNQRDLDFHNPWLVTFVPLKSNGATHKITRQFSWAARPSYLYSSAQVPSCECFNYLFFKKKKLVLMALHNKKESQNRVLLHIRTGSSGLNVYPRAQPFLLIIYIW